MFEELNGKGLLIHHWDTDGICSARLILESLRDKEIINVTPKIGNYYLFPNIILIVLLLLN